jgi:hypothetical protein
LSLVRARLLAFWIVVCIVRERALFAHLVEKWVILQTKKGLVHQILILAVVFGLMPLVVDLGDSLLFLDRVVEEMEVQLFEQAVELEVVVVAVVVVVVVILA